MKMKKKKTKKMSKKAFEKIMQYWFPGIRMCIDNYGRGKV